MTNRDILNTALRQSAVDLGCAAEDLLSATGRVVRSVAHPDARRYLTLPHALNLVYYGQGIVASVSPELEAIAQEYIRRFPPEHCFETPNMHWLGDRLLPLGYKLCYMAEYFLPDVEAIPELDCGFELRLLTQEDFTGLYTPEWSNALCATRRELDVLGVGAYENGRLIGLAGCSADCAEMWQIGIDVLPEYRRRGIAAALTSRLAKEILARGKVPFYCAAWSNIASIRNAIRAGFRPAWVELTAKPADFVDAANNT